MLAFVGGNDVLSATVVGEVFRLLLWVVVGGWLFFQVITPGRLQLVFVVSCLPL